MDWSPLKSLGVVPWRNTFSDMFDVLVVIPHPECFHGIGPRTQPCMHALEETFSNDEATAASKWRGLKGQQSQHESFVSHFSSASLILFKP